MVSRYILGSSLQKKYASKLEKFNKDMEANGKYYLLTLRLIPVFPFFLINLMAGLTNIRLSTFFWTTAVGILPGSFVFTYAGSALNDIESPGDIISGKVLAALIFLGVMATLPVIIKKFGRKKGLNGA